MSKDLKDGTGQVDSSSGNVFVDLGLPASDKDMLKVQIARAITLTVQRGNLTQSQAAKLLGVDQAKISQLLRGKVKGYSVERLIMYLSLLGRDIDINISKARADRQGEIRVNAA